MLRKILIISILVIFQFYLFSESLTNPKNPKGPNTQDDSAKTFATVEFQKQNGLFLKGQVQGLKNYYIKGLSWVGNDNASQDILLDLVQNIRVKGYTMVRKPPSKNLTMILYYPYIFDITMKDGTKIAGAKGRIKQLETFELFTDVGKQKCYSYFVRYWLEDKKIFTDNNSKNYDENPKVPKDVVIYIEFKNN